MEPTCNYRSSQKFIEDMEKQKKDTEEWVTKCFIHDANQWYERRVGGQFNRNPKRMSDCEIVFYHKEVPTKVYGEWTSINPEIEVIQIDEDYVLFRDILLYNRMVNDPNILYESFVDDNGNLVK